MDKTVLLTIQMTKGLQGISHKHVVVPEEKTAEKTCAAAELKWLNEYINRATPVRTFKNVQQAKSFIGVTIKSRIE